MTWHRIVAILIVFVVVVVVVAGGSRISPNFSLSNVCVCLFVCIRICNIIIM